MYPYLILFVGQDYRVAYVGKLLLELITIKGLSAVKKLEQKLGAVSKLKAAVRTEKVIVYSRRVFFSSTLSMSSPSRYFFIPSNI